MAFLRGCSAEIYGIISASLDEALICYETSLRLRDTPMGRYDMAGVLIRMGRIHEALDELHRAQSMRCTEDLAEMIEQRIRSLD